MSNKKKNRKKQQHRPEQDEPPANHGEGQLSMVYTVRIEPHPDEQNRYAEEQESRKKQLGAAKMLNWISAIGAGIAFLALIALIWYASISKGQLNGILETNKISRATLEMSQRAYLFAETPIFIRQQPKVAIGINNLGHTPATKVKVYVHEARFKETGGVPNVIHSKSYEFGGDMTQIPSENGRYGVTILLEDLGENEISEIITGHEQLQIGITIEYYSGFHDDKPGFCYRYASFNAGAWDACPVYDFARLPK